MTIATPNTHSKTLKMYGLGALSQPSMTQIRVMDHTYYVTSGIHGVTLLYCHVSKREGWILPIYSLPLTLFMLHCLDCRFCKVTKSQMVHPDVIVNDGDFRGLYAVCQALSQQKQIFFKGLAMLSYFSSM